MTRRFWVSAALTLPLFVFAMSEMLPGGPARRRCRPSAGRHGCSCCWPRRWCCGAAGRSSSAAGRSIVHAQPQHVHADRARHGRRLHVYSVVATLAPGVFPAPSAARDGEVAVYFEAAAVIITLVLLGQVLELRRAAQTSSAIRALLGLAPPTARRIERRRQRRGGAAGARCTPATGCGCARARRCRSTAWSTKAAARVDESMITGEPMPVAKHAGDSVTGGTVNGTGSIGHGGRARRRRHAARADRADGGRGAAQSRAPIQRLADTVAGWFVPAVIAVAVLTFARLGGLGPGPAPGLRPGQRRRRADHRLPVRARPGHADVDHGRHRAGAPSTAC